MSSQSPEGLFEHLILTLLKKDISYGYGLIKKIRQITGNHWDPSYGTVYGTLSRLEENDFIKRVEKNKEDRKYFKITKKGIQRLNEYEQSKEEMREKTQQIILGLMNIYKEFNDEEKIRELMEKINEDFPEVK